VLNYTRVIPRDFFNESKLLKCFGKLSLSVLDGHVPTGIGIDIHDTGDAFKTELSDDGWLYIDNIETLVNGRVTTFRTLYNSKRNYPFYCIDPESLEDIEVFDDAGEFTEEFVSAFKKDSTIRD
jgi:hypothetical protein